MYPGVGVGPEFCYYPAMRYRIEIGYQADAELTALPPFHRRQVADAIAQILSGEPTRESRSRIKRLHQPAASVYRMRVGDYRVFYDVEGGTVIVLHIRHKAQTTDLYGGQP